MRAGRLRLVTVIAILGWGVMALGAVRPWGYVPLLAAMAVYSAASFLTREESSGIGRGLVVSFVVLCAAVALQLIPLPGNLREVVSPGLQLAGMPASPHGRPLSIDPRRTAVGLTFLVTLGLFFVALARTMGRDGIRSIAVAVVGLGALVAAVGIAEVSTSWGGVYATAGLPMPPDSIPHGPFSSRNHYVGWMLMAFAVALAYWFAILREPHRATTGQLLVIQIAATVMAIAIVQTRSRAGILGLIFVTAMLCGAALHRATARSSRTLLLSVAAGLLIAAVASTGLHPILNRFVTHSWTTAHGRLPIWRQAAAIASDFPATGSGLNTYQTVVRFYPSKDIDHAYEGAHNDFLQLAVEGGVLIGLPALAVVGFFVLETGRRLREPGDDSVIEWLRLGSSVGLLVVAAQETVDFSLQIPGNAALFAVLAAMAVHHPPRKRAGATTLAGGGGTQPA